MLIFILFIFKSVSCLAADFDALLSEQIKEYGIFNDGCGIIYAAVVENDTMLAVIAADKAAFTVRLFGADNEPADTLSLNYKQTPAISVSTDDDFYVCVSDDKCYKIVNDAFTPCEKPRSAFVKLAGYKNNALKLYTAPNDIYDLLNSLKSERISRFPSKELRDSEQNELLLLIKACADIQSYDASDFDTDALMRSVLYTHRNFMLITDTAPRTDTVSDSLNMCSEKFISAAIYKAFRITAKRPAVNMLSSLGYCVNNGYYYYRGGYKKYFATDVKGIEKAVPTGDDTLYIIFRDSYLEGGEKPIDEYSSAAVKKDGEGWYLTAVTMNSDFSDFPAPSDAPRGSLPLCINHLRVFMTAALLLLGAAAAALSVWLARVLRR